MTIDRAIREKTESLQVLRRKAEYAAGEVQRVEDEITELERIAKAESLTARDVEILFYQLAPK